MALMKIAELRDLSTDDLYAELERLRRHAFDLRSQAVTEKLENPFQLTATRRTIARLLTVMHERGETGIEEKEHHIEAVASTRR